MPRPIRKCLPEATYHITSRCRNKLPLMKEILFKEIMVEIMNKTMAKYKFELSGYTIMNNHFHFIIKTIDGEASISRIMQYIKSRFVEMYNKITNTKGPFWNERFSDVIIEEVIEPVKYLLILLCYLAFNPVKSGYSKKPEDYKYSSINSYLNKEFDSTINIILHEFFINLGDSFDECVAMFLVYNPYGVRPPNYPPNMLK